MFAGRWCVDRPSVCKEFLRKLIRHQPMAPPSMVMYINSSIVNNIVPMLNIANNGAAEYGNIQKSKTTVNSSIVSPIKRKI